ncbi:MAG: UvrD-helicase domain-containing protein [Pseudobdellovibrionaceae bacterium]
MAEKKGLFKPLMKNYRSQKPLLEFFNDYFSKVSPQFSKMEAAGPEAAEEKPKVAQVLVCAEDEEKESSEIEASAVLFRVQELLKGGTEPEQIAILARKNAQLAAIAEKAEQVGIPVQLHASARFFDRIEIRDALALLKFLVNPHDNLNLLCLLRSPWLRVPDAVIAQHCDKKAFSYWTHLSRSGEPAIERLKGLLVRSRSESVSQLWLQQLVDLGFFDSCLLHDSTGKREANLWKVVHSLFHQERQNGFSYNAFIQEAKWAMESGLSDESDAIPVIESRRINLMTVHASKGLQFKHVILPFFGKAKTGIDTSILTFDSTKKYWSLKIPNSSGKLESSLVTDDWKAELAKREKEESDRVLYVAMTRAQETISLVWHQKVEKGSWAAAFPYKLEEGVHSLDLFSYEIRKGFFSPELTPKKILQVSEISKPWQKELREFVEERTSFSEQNKIDLTKMVSKAFLNLTKASHRGIFMHKVMESIKFNSEEDLKKWVQSEVPAKEVESTLKALDFILTLSEPNLLSIVKNGAAEWGFTYTREGRRVQGQIDLWGRDETGKLWVVDYKTGSSEFEAKAFEQLDSYVNALQICKKTKPGEQVARVVIYPFEQKVVIACTYRSPGKTNR